MAKTAGAGEKRPVPFPGFRDGATFTQVPNSFFDLWPQLGSAERQVLLVVVRHTLGFHRQYAVLPIRKVAGEAGLATSTAFAGMQACLRRGTVKRAGVVPARDPHHKPVVVYAIRLQPGHPLEDVGYPQCYENRNTDDTTDGDRATRDQRSENRQTADNRNIEINSIMEDSDSSPEPSGDERDARSPSPGPPPPECRGQSPRRARKGASGGCDGPQAQVPATDLDPRIVQAWQGWRGCHPSARTRVELLDIQRQVGAAPILHILKMAPKLHVSTVAEVADRALDVASSSVWSLKAERYAPQEARPVA